MKLTDKRIIEIAGETVGLNQEGYPCFEADVNEVVDFARAILKEAGVEELERERDHWKANHDNQVLRARVLLERPDMPLERVRAYTRYAELELDAERYRWLKCGAVKTNVHIARYYLDEKDNARDELIFGAECDAIIDEAMKAK